MDIILDRALESYDFNARLFDVMMDDFPTSVAMEAGDAESKPEDKNTVNINQTNTTAKTVAPKPDDAKNSETIEDGDKKQAPGIMDKIKKAIDYVIEIVTQAFNKFQQSMTYIISSGKNYEAEIVALEKKYMPRYDIVVTNRRYNSDIITNSIKAYNVVYEEFRNVMLSVHDSYTKVTNNSMTPEQFKDTIDKKMEEKIVTAPFTRIIEVGQYPSQAKVSDAKESGDKTDAPEKSTNMQSSDVKDATSLFKFIRGCHRGAKEDMTIDQKTYNNARTFIKNYKNNVDALHNTMKKLNQNSRELKSKMTLITRDASDKGKASTVFSQNFVKLCTKFNFYTSLLSFLMSSLNEEVVNSRLIVKTALGG